MSDYQLNKSHHSVGKANPSEDLLYGCGGGNSGIVEEGVGFHSNEEDKTIERLGLPGIGVGEGVNRCPVYVHGIQGLVDSLTDREPSGPNGMITDQMDLTFDALGLRALVDLKIQGVLLGHCMYWGTFQ